jgi:O-antigen/teichoic acid export membrane protein
MQYKNVGKEFTGILLGQFLTIAGSLIGVRLLTEYVSPSVYGNVALGMTVSTLVTQIFLGPLGSSAARFYSPSKEQESFTAFWGALKFFIATVGCFLFCTFLFFLVFKEQFEVNLNSYFCFFVFLFSILTGNNSILNRIQNAARQRFVVAWHQALGTWLRFGFAILAVIIWLPESTAVMLGYSAAMIAVNISQLFLFEKKIKRDIVVHEVVDKEKVRAWKKKLIAFAWPFGIWGIFTWLQLSSDRWALGYYVSTYDVGLYSVLYQLGYYPVSISSSLLTTLVNPIFFAMAGDGTDETRVKAVQKKIQQGTGLMILGVIFCILVAFFFHEMVFKFLAAENYRSISYLMPFMVLSGGLFAIGQFASLNFLIRNQTRKMLVPKVGTALLGVCFNVIGAKYWGITGVVGANVLFSMVFCLYFVLVKK